MDSVSLAKDVGFHLRIPAAGLVSEMDTRFQQLSNRDRAQATPSRLSLGELESLACTWLAILLSLLDSLVPPQKTRLLEDRTQLRVEPEEGPSYAQANGSCLPCIPSTFDVYIDVKLF